MTVVGPSGGIGTRALSRRYPVDEGLVAGTTKQTGRRTLRPQKSFILKRRPTT